MCCYNTTVFFPSKRQVLRSIWHKSHNFASLPRIDAKIKKESCPGSWLLLINKEWTVNMCCVDIGGRPFYSKKMDRDILCHLNLADLIGSLGCTCTNVAQEERWLVLDSLMLIVMSMLPECWGNIKASLFEVVCWRMGVKAPTVYPLEKSMAKY